MALNFNPALGREAEAGSSLKSSRPTWSTGVVPGQSGTQRNPILKTQKKKKKPAKKVFNGCPSLVDVCIIISKAKQCFFPNPQQKNVVLCLGLL